MADRLLFITSQYFYDKTLQALERIAPACDTHVVPYRDFDDIAEVFLQHRDEADACFVSGPSAMHAIELAVPGNTLPLFSFCVSSNGFYRDILKMAVENQSLDFSRIAMDFLLPVDMGWSLTDYLALDDFPEVVRRTQACMNADTSHGTQWIQDEILKKICQLWRDGQIDRVICLYSSLIPQLEELGIPYRCPFPSDSHLNLLINSALIRIELQRLHNNHPAIVQIFSRRTPGFTPEQHQALEQAIRQFVKTNLMDCVVQTIPDCCLMITSMRVLRFLTNEFTSCQISGWLEENLDFPVNVAYGIGTTVIHAMNNVQLASREAKLLGKSFLVDTNGNLIGPLDTQNVNRLPSHAMTDVSKIARRCGLSAMTIHKLMAIVRSSGSDKITTQELAMHFQTTIRNANRIILNLCKGQVATPVYTQPSHSRGRPIQVYLLKFGPDLPR